jgi:hypothetical protein
MDRIAAIQRSLAAFAWGIASFVPLLGFISAVCALAHWYAVHRKYQEQWNPASRYLAAGLVLAIIGFLESTLLAAVITLAIADSFF